MAQNQETSNLELRIELTIGFKDSVAVILQLESRNIYVCLQEDIPSDVFENICVYNDVPVRYKVLDIDSATKNFDKPLSDTTK